MAALWGVRELPARGILHVTSALRAPDGALHVLRIGPLAPPSETDFFLLNLARARADAIITTAAVIRAEPHVRIALQGPQAPALERYRRDVLGKREPPLCVILTRRGTLPGEHALWTDGIPKLVLTEPAQADALARELGDRAQVQAVAGLDARSACDVLQRRGAGLISIEAGPTANAALYEPPSRVDELSLSLFEGTAAEGSIGAALSSQLCHGMTCVADTRREEPSGPWRYQRWLRACNTTLLVTPYC